MFLVPTMKGVNPSSFLKVLRIQKDMAFNDIPKVESADFFIEVAFRKAREKADRMRGSFISEDNLAKSRQIESAKVKEITGELNDRLFYIVKSFPDLDDLHEFYRELIRSMIDWVFLKKSLGAVNWYRLTRTRFS